MIDTGKRGVCSDCGCKGILVTVAEPPQWALSDYKTYLSAGGVPSLKTRQVCVGCFEEHYQKEKPDA